MRFSKNAERLAAATRDTFSLIFVSSLCFTAKLAKSNSGIEI